MRALLTSLPAQVVAGLVLLGLAAAVRALTNNRIVRSRLRLTMLLAAVFLGIRMLGTGGVLRADLQPLAQSVSALVFAFAAIQFAVLVLLNPLRADRVPDRFPTIIQDAIVFTLFAVVATVVMNEKFLTTSAVGALVAGLALQDTLGNLVSGLAIQVEKPFRLGHWVSSGEWEGEVVEITWRATKLRTRQGNQVIVPNSELAKSSIVNYSEPASPTRLEIDIGADYNDPPNRVKAVILDVLGREPLVLDDPAPAVHLVSFDASSIVYRIRFWITRFPMDEVITDRVRTAIYYAFRREQITIPYPIQVEYGLEPPPAWPDAAARRAAAERLGETDLFALLEPGQREALVAASALRVYGAGEPIVHQGDAGRSAFVVQSGRARVGIEPGDVEIAMLGPGQYFGEMSLLTGDQRVAGVRALDDCTVLEITSDAFRRFVLERPELLARITEVVAGRRAELASARHVTQAIPVESATSLLARVRRFFGVAFH